MALKLDSILVISFLFLVQRKIICAEPLHFHFKVQEPVEPFVGRHGFLQTLHEALTRKVIENSVQYSSITFVTGRGGIGKTETTRKYIETYAHAFENVIWIEAENELQVEKSFRSLANSTNIPEPTSHSEMTDETIESIYQALGRDRKKTLMIFDNVDKIPWRFFPSDLNKNSNEESDFWSNSDDPDSKSDLIPPSILILQTKGQSSSVKSREQMEIVKWLPLHPFTDNENINYILHHPNLVFGLTCDDMPEVKVIENARLLGQLLGGIPLALKQAMAFISINFKAHPEKGLEKYLSLFYKEVKIQNGANLPNDGKSPTFDPLFMTWKITREKLSGGSFENFATFIMDSLAYFPPSKMSIRLLFYILAGGKEPIRHQIFHNKQALLIKIAINTLHLYSIVNIDHDQSDPKVDRNLDFDLDLVKGTLNVHKGLQAAVLKNFKEQQVHFKLGEQATKYNTTAQYLLFQSQGLLDKIIEENGELSLDELYSIAAILDGIDFTTEILASKTPDIETLKSIAIARFKTALQFHKQLNSFEGESTCKKLLSSSFYQLRQIELKFEPDMMNSSEFQKQIIDLVQRSTPPDRYSGPRSSQPLNIQDILLEVASEVFGEDHSLRIIFLQEAADFLGKKQGPGYYHRQTFVLYDEVYETKKRVFGAESKEVISVLHKLAEIYQNLRDLSKSFEIYSRIYELEQKVYGSDYIFKLPTAQRMASILAQKGQYQEALDLLKSLVKKYKIMESIHQPQTCDTGGCENTEEKIAMDTELQIDMLDNIAGYHIVLKNHLEAYKILENLYNLDLKSRGPDDLRTMAHESKMAKVLHLMHQNEKAMKMQLHVHQIREKVLGPDHIYTMETKYDLARLYLEQGNYENSLELFSLVYDFRKKTLGEETRPTLAALDGIADVHMNQKNQKIAHEMKNRVHTLSKKLYGEEALETINALSDVALTSVSLGGNNPEAIKEILNILKKVYNLRKKMLGFTHEQTLAALFRLCEFQAQGGGEHNKALQQLESALKIINKDPNLGPESTLAADALDYMSRIQQMQGKIGLALKLSLKVLDILQKTLGAEHPNTVNSLAHIGSIYLSQKNYEEALKFYSKAHSVMTRIYGPEHLKTLDAAENLGSIYIYNDQKDYTKAMSIFSKIYEARANALGEQHPATLSALLSIGIIENNVGNMNAAITIFKRVLKSRLAAYGEKDERTLFVMSHLAWSYTFLKNFEEALQLLVKVYEGRKLSLGEEHANTIDILEQMSSCHQNMGNLEKALKLNSKVYEQRLQTLGKNHPKTKKSFEIKESLESKLKQKTEL